MSILQTILIPRTYTKKQAESWLIKNNFKVTFYGKPVHVTKHFYRYRQHKILPNMDYYTVRLNNGIELVYMDRRKRL